MPKRLLCVSYDSALLRMRAMLLQEAGYEVVAADSFSRAIASRETRGSKFDLVILGHSIPFYDRERLVAHFRQTCRAPIVALLLGHEGPIPGVARSLASDEPNDLLQAVRELLA